jgi:DNA adenine methylase
MKTTISYYGGKQKLVSTILPMIPVHVLYCEPFCGGAAVFFGKEKSEVEVINDTNAELITFYKVVQTDFISLEKEIRISLHSRRLHHDAEVIYSNPHMFSDLKRAWAVWVLAAQGFASMLDGSWGYDKKKGTTSKKISGKRETFSEELAYRLQDVQIECTDALRIIESRDTKDSFFYVDPPYFNSNCGHYDGYSREDFLRLLDRLSKMEGRFLLSSYPSEELSIYIQNCGWKTKSIEQQVSVCKVRGKKKTEVLTWNY